ncbi:unnamed protein product [Triticum turgidum subsp. durum]|uniref:Coatomer subunit beta n=2 Tax=Triticum TaxID=4564 RepID=A0A9R1QXS1_TRITD|nr:unnamed protein product [Triticum aestivum]VAH85598.1 unnamed protein product [Triticum turgidum subsp. durum]
MSKESPCNLLLPFLDKSRHWTAEEIKAGLEGSDDGAKVDALKRAIMLHLNGDGHTIPHLLVTVLRCVLPSKEHTIQRLLLVYLEVVDKRDQASGEVIPEMILVSHHLRSNLQHPNEYIRGVTLRFLCRLREPELLQPMVPAIINNLKHPHPFVRRHALSAISAIFRLPCGEQLIPNAPYLVERALAMEQDPSARRNAFLMLCDCSPDHANAYLLGNAARVAEWPVALQMAALDFVRKAYSPRFRTTYIEIIMSLISPWSKTAAVVVYDCARTLLSVSRAPTLIRAAAEAYFRLLTSESDNKVRLVILDRLRELCTAHRQIMVSFVMDILHSLATADADLVIRSKVLDFVLGLLTTQNVEKVVLYLKKEVFKTMDSVLEMAYEYYLMLVQTIHACAVECPEVAGLVMHILLDFLVYGGDIASASDVIMFVRDVIGTDPLLRVSVIERLIVLLSFIQDSFICSCVLWILGEYWFSLSEVQTAISTIMQTLGDQPFNDVSEKSDESIFDCAPTSGLLDCTHSLRLLIMSGDFHLAAAVACTLTKLVLRLEEVEPSNKVEANKASAESLLMMVSMLQLGNSSYLPHPIDNDLYDRIVFCVRLLCSTDNDHERKVWLMSCHQSFTKMLDEKQSRKNEKMKVDAQNAHAHPDDSIDFYHLMSRRGMGQLELEDEFRDDLKAATGELNDADDADNLNRPIQLTGFSDPLYAEGFVTVNQYHDTVLDITVINRTKETMHNLCLEFATACKNAVLERSGKYTVAPSASEQIQAMIKVSSSNVGIIITRIVYETSDEMGTSEVILKDMSISIADYMTPATCTDVAFRRMWAECPWKVKLKVNTLLHDEKAFLNFIIKSTNMNCLTPLSALDGDCGFVAANLYAKSVFGEDALVNISIAQL